MLKKTPKQIEPESEELAESVINRSTKEAKETDKIVEPIDASVDDVAKLIIKSDQPKVHKALKAQWGTPDNKLKIGDRFMECYVLEGGTRVLSGRGMQEAVGLGRSHGGLLKEFVAQKAIISFIDSDLAMELSNPLRFIRPGRGGKPALAYEATMLPRLCDAILDARKHTKLTMRQAEIAAQCEIVVRALSKVGIIALVDEATGYQEVRDKQVLQKLLETYLLDEARKWERMFQLDYYREIFRLHGWEFSPSSTARPSYVGKITNDVVYDRLQPGVRKKLEEINPKNEKGRRKKRFHSYFTGEVGVPELKEHLSNVVFMMKGASSWKQFKDMLDRARPKVGDTLKLPFDD